MTAALPGLDARLVSALSESPSRIPVLLGPCGSGRTCALQRVRDGLPGGSCQYIDVERVMSSPEQFLGRVTADSPLRWKAPAPAAKWTAPIARSKTAAACLQTGPDSPFRTRGDSEDCLYLNVWTPQWPMRTRASPA